MDSGHSRTDFGGALSERNAALAPAADRHVSPAPAKIVPAFRGSARPSGFACRESSAFIDCPCVPAAYLRLSMFAPSVRPDTDSGLC
jgi:hypothetical protein